MTKLINKKWEVSGSSLTLIEMEDGATLSTKGTGETIFEQMENAKLISAAPDLLDALMECIRLHEKGGTKREVEFIVAVSKAAITKAGVL